MTQRHKICKHCRKIGADKRAQRRAVTNIQSAKTAVSVTCDDGKCKKARYACNQTLPAKKSPGPDGLT